MIAALALALVLAADTPAGVISPSGLPGLAAPEPGAGGPIPTDTLTRVPGSVIRLGWKHERAAALGSFPLSSSDANGETREGEVRWFGYPARAALTYRSDRLSAVRLTATSVSARFGDYVPDELRRLGYRRVGATISAGTRITDWAGPAMIRLTVAGGNVIAEVSPREAPAPTPPPAVADAPPVDFTAPGAESLGTPRRLSTPADPVRPQVAVDAGVFGRVVVLARVGLDGGVEHAEIERGIPELDNAALEWASGVRFEPWRVDGRPAKFRIRIPVAFLPVRSGGGESRP